MSLRYDRICRILNCRCLPMKPIRLLIVLSLAPVSQAFAHGGHFHLDEETLEKIFQFMDDVYRWFVGHLPLMFGALVAMLVLLAIGKAVRSRSNG